MKRKTYNNVLKAAKIIQKKGYSRQESLEIAVKVFDDLGILNNGMSVEWLIEKLADVPGINTVKENKDDLC